ncbi:MAG: SIS domain-containing protein, partial [Oscillospiraceae bacterium]
MAELKSEMHAYLEKVKSTIDTLDLNELNDALTALVAANERCAAIYVMGNGGSAATASHMVCDFNKGISNFSPNKFRMICLSDNLPTLSAIANDLSYDDVFFEQLRGALEPGDVVIA